MEHEGRNIDMFEQMIIQSGLSREEYNRLNELGIETGVQPGSGHGSDKENAEVATEYAEEFNELTPAEQAALRSELRQLLEKVQAQGDDENKKRAVKSLEKLDLMEAETK